MNIDGRGVRSFPRCIVEAEARFEYCGMVFFGDLAINNFSECMTHRVFDAIEGACRGG
tara:strand:+ start:157 stop:330 length:174 start_codon:yes stop_codon:yes gene_type:complete